MDATRASQRAVEQPRSRLVDLCAVPPLDKDGTLETFALTDGTAHLTGGKYTTTVAATGGKAIAIAGIANQVANYIEVIAQQMT